MTAALYIMLFLFGMLVGITIKEDKESIKKTFYTSIESKPTRYCKVSYCDRVSTRTDGYCDTCWDPE